LFWPNTEPTLAGDTRHNFAGLDTSAAELKVLRVDSPTGAAANGFAFAVVKRLAAFLLPLGIGLGDFLQISKAAFVAAASDHIRARGDRVSTSRIAVITGLSRAEVAKIRANGHQRRSIVGRQRTERVMHGWHTDSAFVDESGKPRSLPVDGGGSFAELVRKYGGDVPPRAVFRELIAGGMARIGASGDLVPIRRHFVAAAGDELDFGRLEADANVFFDGAVGSRTSRYSTLRRVSVRFRTEIPTGVRKNVALRTERFLEALSEYLHAAADHSAKRADSENEGEAFHVLVAQAELDDNPTVHHVRRGS
jgi:Family of unknown function (DUF6502)